MTTRDAKQFDNYWDRKGKKFHVKLRQTCVATRRRLVCRMQISGIIHILCRDDTAKLGPRPFTRRRACGEFIRQVLEFPGPEKSRAR